MPPSEPWPTRNFREHIHFFVFLKNPATPGRKSKRKVASNWPCIKFSKIGDRCKSLDTKVGPQGFEPWTKGL